MSRQQCELRHKERIFWRLSDIKADLAPVQPNGFPVAEERFPEVVKVPR